MKRRGPPLMPETLGRTKERMNEVGPSALGEEPARVDQRRFRVVAIVALVCAAPFMVGHFIIGAFFVPSLLSSMASLGSGTPPWAHVLLGLRSLLGPLLVLLDAGIFVGCYFLARRWWIGLLFAPIFAYLAFGMLLLPLLYLPLFDVVQQVH